MLEFILKSWRLIVLFLASQVNRGQQRIGEASGDFQVCEITTEIQLDSEGQEFPVLERKPLGGARPPRLLLDRRRKAAAPPARWPLIICWRILPAFG